MMKTQSIAHKNIKSRTFAMVFLSALLLPAYAPSASTTSTPAVTPQPANQIEENHTPVILKVEERTVTKNGQTTIIKDITFQDADGDATTIVDETVWSNQRVTTSNVKIGTSPNEQKEGATVADEWGCAPDLLRVVKTSILDKAGNLSEPVTVEISCPRSKLPNILPLVIAAIAVALVLLVGAWLFLSKRPSERVPLFQSMLLLFFLSFPLSFIYIFLHEGGHALVSRVNGGVVDLFYVHPFSFAAYNMPPFDWSSVLFHAGGALLVLPVSLVISALFWKRRSVSTFLLAMLFPWVAILQGLRILMVTGDFSTIVYLTGLPIPLFIVTGFLLVVIGAFFVASILPLLGLAPGHKRSLFVLPVALFLWATVGITVAYFFVPGTSIDHTYRTIKELFTSSSQNLTTGPIIGGLLAVFYVTLFNKLSPRLPAWLRTETVTLTWKDLRLPGVLWAISVVFGSIIVM